MRTLFFIASSMHFVPCASIIPNGIDPLVATIVLQMSARRISRVTHHSLGSTLN